MLCVAFERLGKRAWNWNVLDTVPSFWLSWNSLLDYGLCTRRSLLSVLFEKYWNIKYFQKRFWKASNHSSWGPFKKDTTGKIKYFRANTIRPIAFLMFVVKSSALLVFRHVITLLVFSHPEFTCFFTFTLWLKIRKTYFPRTGSFCPYWPSYIEVSSICLLSTLEKFANNISETLRQSTSFSGGCQPTGEIRAKLPF